MQYFGVMKKIVSATVLLVLVIVSLFAGETVIRDVDVSPSAILTEEEIDAIVSECLDRFTGIDILIGVVDRINALYLAKGYPNAMAFIPEQTVQDGTAVIELLEGRIGDVSVSGNTYTADSYILKSLRLEKGSVLNLSDLENRLHTFNRWNPGLRLVSTLNPGKGETGTTDIDISVSESFPTGAYATFDNSASEATGGYRTGVHVVANSLTGNRDTFLTGCYFNIHSRSLYADYSIPTFDSVSDETRLGIKGTVGGSETASGPASEFDIRNVTVNGSAYISMLLKRTTDSNTTAVVSANVGSTTTYALNTLLTNEIIVSGRLGISSSDKLSDIFSLSCTAGLAVGTPYKGAGDLDNVYLKFDAGLQARLTFPGMGYMLLSASGQYMPFNRLIPNQEQMYIGGSNTVRGYPEGCAWGKDAFFTNLELHFLIPWSTRSTLFGFVDYGMTFPSIFGENTRLVGLGGGIDVYMGTIFHFKASIASAMTDIGQGSNPKGIKCSISAALSTPNI